MSIEEGLSAVRERIAQAAKVSGRRSEDITLVAVSKFKSADEIRRAAALGATDFGENYIQEFTEKYALLNSEGLRWHIIGNVQRNKVKYIADKDVTVQTVDRLSLAEELSKQAGKYSRTMRVLLQANTSGEDTKSGCAPSELESLFEKCLELENIDVRGIMTIGPNTNDTKSIEICFEKTYELFDAMKKHEKYREQIKYLSMGMTDDYALAIKHGANIVRIGRAIFGDRPTK